MHLLHPLRLPYFLLIPDGFYTFAHADEFLPCQGGGDLSDGFYSFALRFLADESLPCQDLPPKKYVVN